MAINITRTVTNRAECLHWPAYESSAVPNCHALCGCRRASRWC